MSLVLGLTAALIGGGKHCRPACCNMGVVYTAAPCAQPVFGTPIALAGCTPIEIASPVASTTTETEKAEPVSQLRIEKDPALAAADRPETLSQELGMGVTARPVSSTNTFDGGGQWGGALGFLGNLGGNLGTTSGGFGFGNGQGAPGRGSGFGGGFGGGGGFANPGGSDVNVNSDPGTTNQGIVVNVNTTIANLNNNSQSQLQNQYQTQTQNQNQNQSQSGDNGHCCNGGGEQIPLPATVWMGLIGSAAAVFVRKRAAR